MYLLLFSQHTYIMWSGMQQLQVLSFADLIVLVYCASLHISMLCFPEEIWNFVEFKLEWHSVSLL